jgi:phosphoserine phosphatase
MAYKALALDVCGVLTTHKSVWQFIHEELGIWEGNASRFQEEFLAGLIDYRAFCERDAALWAGLEVSRLEEIVSRLPYRQGIAGLFETARRLGLSVGLISTGLTLLTDRIGRDFPVDFAAANRLVTDNGLFTGGVEIAVPHDGKGHELVRYAGAVGVSAREVIAVGDGTSDVPMFLEAGCAVGFGDATEGMGSVVDLRTGTSLYELATTLRDLCS